MVSRTVYTVTARSMGSHWEITIPGHGTTTSQHLFTARRASADYLTIKVGYVVYTSDIRVKVVK